MSLSFEASLAPFVGTYLEQSDPHFSAGQRLCVAMISRAVLDLRTSDLKAKRSAQKWLFEAGPDYVLSFTNCCEELCLSVSLVRSSALKLHRAYQESELDEGRDVPQFADMS